MPADATADVEELVERAEEDPESVTVADIRPYLEAEDEITQKRALDVCQAVAYVDSERIAPLVPELIEFAGDDFLASKNAALGTISHLAPDETDAVAEGLETLTRALDSETPITRYLAAKCVAFVAADRPEEVAEHVEQLFAALNRESPDFPEEIQQGKSFSSPDETTPERDEISKNVAQAENARELAAKTVVEVTKADPDAIEPYIENVHAHVDDTNQVVSGALIEVVSILSSEGYTLPAGTADRIESTLPEGSTQLRARSLRALGYLSATGAVDTIRDVAEDTDDEDLATFAEETANWLESASE